MGRRRERDVGEKGKEGGGRGGSEEGGREGKRREQPISTFVWLTMGKGVIWDSAFFLSFHILRLYR